MAWLGARVSLHARAQTRERLRRDSENAVLVSQAVVEHG